MGEEVVDCRRKKTNVKVEWLQGEMKARAVWRTLRATTLVQDWVVQVRSGLYTATTSTGKSFIDFGNNHVVRYCSIRKVGSRFEADLTPGPPQRVRRGRRKFVRFSCCITSWFDQGSNAPVPRPNAVSRRWSAFKKQIKFTRGNAR